MTKRRIAMSGLLSVALTTPCLAGSLTPPPGPPGPTMTTLSNVEPRQAVNELPGSAVAVHVINQPGSYHLTGDITGEPSKHGIFIDVASGDVVIDMRGFSLLGVPGSLAGIRQDPPAAQTQGFFANDWRQVINGSILNWDQPAIAMPGAPSVDLRDLFVADCGPPFSVCVGPRAFLVRIMVENAHDGAVWCGLNSIIMHSSAHNAVGAGFTVEGSGKLMGCAAYACDVGFDLRDCTSIANSQSLGSQWGFMSGQNCRLTDLVAHATVNDGFRLGAANQMSHSLCTAFANSIGSGVVLVGPNSSVKSTKVDGVGMYAFTALAGAFNAHFEDNEANNAGTDGFAVHDNSSKIIGNSIAGSARWGVVVADQAVGAMVEGNQITGSGDSGVMIMNDHAMVMNNQIFKTGAFGVLISDGVTGCLVGGNQFSQTPFAPVEDPDFQNFVGPMVDTPELLGSASPFSNVAIVAGPGAP